MIWTKLFRVTCICFVFSACVGVRPVFFGSKKTSKTKTKAQNEKTSTKYGVSLCRTINIQQEINIEGCGLKRIRNKACMGKCGSYYLPRVYPRDLHNSIQHMQRCQCCKPSLSTWMVVPLHCPHLKRGQKIDKLVQIINECKCSTCLA